jgi:hypothetical protein
MHYSKITLGNAEAFLSLHILRKEEAQLEMGFFRSTA